jgi:hypothetical protein
VPASHGSPLKLCILLSRPGRSKIRGVSIVGQSGGRGTLSFIPATKTKAPSGPWDDRNPRRGKWTWWWVRAEIPAINTPPTQGVATGFLILRIISPHTELPERLGTVERIERADTGQFG